MSDAPIGSRSAAPRLARTADGDEPLIAARRIVKRFGGVVALGGVDLSVRRGEVHALVGENGSGKSTLVRILSGTLAPDAGELALDGRAVARLTPPRTARALGIGYVSQELTLAPSLSVAENIVMGGLPVGRGARRAIRWGQARRIARAALDSLDVEIDERERVGDLNIELQQQVEIARALALDCRLLILDEATSSLSESAAGRLIERVLALRASGVSTIFVSHRLPEVFACADRATVLRDGRLIETLAMSDVDEQGLVRRMVGRDIADLFGQRQRRAGAPVLSVRGLSSTDGRVNAVSFDVPAGEVLGIAGLGGSGKSELALSLVGALPARGDVKVAGQPLRLGTARGAIAAGVGFVPEDRKRDALFPTLSVGRNLSAAWLSELTGAGVVSARRERERVTDVLRTYGVRTPSAHAGITELSGGNQQKVVFARVAAQSPAVLVLAEPTRGVDVGAKSEIYRVVQQLAEAGTAIVLVSSELPELLGLADRVLVMYQGAVAAELDAATATEARITHVASGGQDDGTGV